ncbi:death domain-associated protein 6 [Pelodytes ibericus]
MAHMDEIIVLDDDDDEEEEIAHSSNTKTFPQKPETKTAVEKDCDDSLTKVAVISAQNNKLFEEFVDYCSGLTVEHPEVLSFLKGRFSRANSSFLSSTEFCNILGRCLTRVQSKRSKVYVYINELCTALKANSQKRKVSLQPPSTSHSPVDHGEKVDEKTKEAKEQGEDDNHTNKPGSKRQIRYLENLLQLYSREIQKLQERELSLDELENEDSAYIQEARLKRKLLLIFNKLCQLKDCSSLTGRVIEQRIPYRGTRYPEINRRLEKFINGSQDIFPDYGDVLRVIQRASDKHGLSLSRKQMQGMAQDAFRELGNRLQERRHLDLVYNFGCHLTDTYKPGNDPAHQDPTLHRRLRDNRNMAVTRLDDLIKKYAVMQDEGEEEEQKKKRKESELPQSSKSKRQTPSPQSHEDEESEDEDEEESETDIEEELKHCQEMSDGEEGEEEEAEEHPADQDNEADQRMEIQCDLQPSSGGDEEEDEEQVGEGDDGNEEDTEEPSAKGKTVDPSLPHAQRSTTATLQVEVIPLAMDPSPDSSIEEASSHSQEHTQNTEQEGVGGTASRSEDLETLQMHNNMAQDDDMEEAVKSVESSVEGDDTGRDTPASMKSDHDEARIEEDSQSDGERCSVADEQDGIEAPDINTTAMNEADGLHACVGEESILKNNGSPCLTGDEQSSGSGGTEEESGESHTENSTQIDSEVPCAESHSKESNICGDKEVSCLESSLQTEQDTTLDKNTTDLVCDKSHMRSDSPSSNHPVDKDSTLDSNRFEDTQGLHVSSRNGVTHVSIETQASTDESIEPTLCNRTNASAPPPRKRKRSPKRLLLKNGSGTLNGSKETEAGITQKCKRARNDRSYASLPSSPDPDSDNTPDISLDLMVTCSPPSSPPNPCHRSHASTQCDPDEVIVLSD